MFKALCRMNPWGSGILILTVTTFITGLVTAVVTHGQAFAGSGPSVASAAPLWLPSTLVAAFLCARRVYLARVGRRAARAALQTRKLDIQLGNWQGAKLLRLLELGRFPHPQQNWGLVLGPDEVAYISSRARYSRFYGTTVQYTRKGVVAFGSPTAVATALLGNRMINSMRENEARRLAARQWRDVHSCPILLTTHRLACNTRDGWVSFYHPYMTSVHIELDAAAVVIEFSSDCAPLRIETPEAAVVAVWLCWAAWGKRGIQEHRALEPIRRLANEVYVGPPDPTV